MTRLPWFRFYVETPTDPKVRRLTPAQRWLWTVVLAAARKSPAPGHLLLGEGLPYTTKDLAEFAGMTPHATAQGVDAMRSLGVLEFDESADAWFVPRWTDRQPDSDDVSERTARHRAKKRRGERSENVGDTELETDTEERVARTRGSRIPETFSVTPEMQAWVLRECPNIDWQLHTANFVDWAKSCSTRNAVKKDWTRAWQKWMRSEEAKVPQWKRSKVAR